jgi:hypothetical protein
MAKLTWDETENRLYDLGLDRGVLYLEDQSGVAWNGLTEVTNDLGSFTTVGFFYDGQKFIDYPLSGDFAAKLKAYTYPEEFTEYAGYYDAKEGLAQGNQHKKSFSLSYRTLTGDAVSGHDDSYKIHIMYDLVATMDTLGYDTQSDDISPIEFGWAIKSKPSKIEGYKPTAYAIVDSRYLDPDMLDYLETIIYGTPGTEPHLPPLDTLLFMLDAGATIIITDHGDGTWSAEGSETLITMLDPTTFQITEVNAVYLDQYYFSVTTT